MVASQEIIHQNLCRPEITQLGSDRELISGNCISFITVDCSEYVCHSFLCSTVRHAERILMALGQAFEGKEFELV